MSAASEVEVSGTAEVGFGHLQRRGVIVLCHSVMQAFFRGFTA